MLLSLSLGNRAHAPDYVQFTIQHNTNILSFYNYILIKYVFIQFWKKK